MKTSDSCVVPSRPSKSLRFTRLGDRQLHYPAFSDINEQHLIVSFFVQFLARNCEEWRKGDIPLNISKVKWQDKERVECEYLLQDETAFKSLVNGNISSYVLSVLTCLSS